MAARALNSFEKESTPFESTSISSIGIRFDRVHAEARGGWLTFSDSPLLHAPEILATQAESLSAKLLRQIVNIERGNSNSDLREEVASELTSIAIRLSERLIVDVGDAASELVAIGIHGSGTWHGRDLGEGTRVNTAGHREFERGIGSRSYCELVQSSQVAERFGITVIDDFPSRDLAQGGCGGPVEGHGNWILLADRSPTPGVCWRALVDVSSHVTHLSLIPSMKRKVAEHVFLSEDICVGGRLFAELVSMASLANSNVANAANKRPGFGELAVAGRVIPELAEIWAATSQQSRRWNPDGISALPFVYALKNSVYASSSLENQLATATHFLATEIHRNVRHRVPASKPVGELFLMGEGCSKNGLLVERLNELLPEVSMRLLSELGQDRTVYAASIAALTLLHIWQIPVPPTNPSEVPRVLGRLTPGSPSNWRRVLLEMTTSAPWLLPLREAI